MMEPLLKKQAEKGNPLPDRMPKIELDDLSDDPVEARRILDDFMKNVTDYDTPLPMFEKRDEWLYPSLSTGLKLFNKRIDNTTGQVANAIRSVANSGQPMQRRSKPEKTIDGTLIPNQGDGAIKRRFREYQGVLGEALLTEFPELVEELRDPIGGTDVHTYKSMEDLVSSLLEAGHGDKIFTEEKQDEILSGKEGYSMDEWRQVQRDFYTRTVGQQYNQTNPKGNVEGGARHELGNFGVKYLLTLPGGSQDEPTFNWQNVLK